MFVSCVLKAQVKVGPKNSKIRLGKEEEKGKLLQRDISLVLNIYI